MIKKQFDFANSSLLKEKLKKYFPDMGDSEDEVEQAMVKILKNHPKEFGLNLRKIRTSVGLLQKTLCDTFGVSQNTWSCWEKGTHSPRLANLDQISSYLKIDIGELFIGLKKSSDKVCYLQNITINLPNFPSEKLISKLKTYFPLLEETEIGVSNAYGYVICGFPKIFGANLRKERVNKGFTQKDMYMKLSVTPSTYSYWETGSHPPRPTKIEEICKALNIDPADLINVNPVSSEAIYDRKVPILPLDFFKAKTFGSAFSEFKKLDLNRLEKLKADEYGKYDFAVKVTNTDMTSDRVSLPNGGIALCSWKDLMGKEPLEQMQVADGSLALVSIVYNSVVFREVHFDGKFLTLKCWNKDQEEKRFPVKLGDEAMLKDPEQAKFAEIVVPACFVQIFGIVKTCIINYF